MLGDFLEVEARALRERDQNDLVKGRFAVAALAPARLAFGRDQAELLIVTQRRCRHGGALGHLADVDQLIGWPSPFRAHVLDCVACSRSTKVEIINDYGLTDIVAQRFDAGVRDGEQIAKDMIAVRIAPDTRMAVVATPFYFRSRPEPKKPQDLVEHNCINLRLPTHGGLYAWEFEKGSRELKVRVDGQLYFSTTTQMLHAGLAGLGLAYLPEGLVQPHINKGRLKRVLADWCPPYPGYHLYYPTRRQPSAAFTLLVEALRRG